ncbi:M10 family metallopeptidase C-terminal domain-containing protein [Gemmobacter serpentinus]|uniref:M10 family metallopeptidase C-terminal domain-containing protein n=1 Tax=Gemmobacter serpentinus TaxID=2652247 RepID=UPI00124BECE4|nr:hypothetical protein [Gemmobacter serpentinus]
MSYATTPYQWLHAGAVTGRASSSSYRLIKADVGAGIAVRISYADGLGTRETLVSAATACVVLAAVTGGGNDTLTGRAGADQFVFAAGDDLITDLNKGQKDRLLLSDDLWNGKMTAKQVVQTFGEVVKGGVMLEFDSGDSVTIRGITSLNALVSQIDVICGHAPPRVEAAGKK